MKDVQVLTNSTEQNPSWEADSHSSGQEITHLLWNPDVHYRVHNSPPLAHILSQMNPVRSLPPCCCKIHSFHLFLGLPSGIFSLGFSIKILYAFQVTLRACEFRLATFHVNMSWMRRCTNSFGVTSWVLCVDLAIFSESSVLWYQIRRVNLGLDLKIGYGRFLPLRVFSAIRHSLTCAFDRWPWNKSRSGYVQADLRFL
jgi:hypothetical protein